MGLAALISSLATSNSASSVLQLFTSAQNQTGSAQGLSSPTASNGTKFDRSFVLIQNEFGWNGTSGGPLITVTKGDRVQITIINAGRMVHNFGIARVSKVTENLLDQISNARATNKIENMSYTQLSAMPCPGCQPVYSQAHIDKFMSPLSQQTVFFKASESGNFKYFCMVRGHLWLGMIGNLVIQDRNQGGPL